MKHPSRNEIPYVENRPETFRGVDVSGKKTATKVEKVSSSVFFESLRPKFLDWEPPTDKQKALEARARKDAKEAELKRVTDLAKKRDAEKRSPERADVTRRSRDSAATNPAQAAKEKGPSGSSMRSSRSKAP